MKRRFSLTLEKFLASRPGYKPVLLLIAFIVYAILVIIPLPEHD